MLTLFGMPHLQRALDAYDEAAPLVEGWEDRLVIHQLFPLLVHACLFGGGYGARAASIAGRYRAAPAYPVTVRSTRPVIATISPPSPFFTPPRCFSSFSSSFFLPPLPFSPLTSFSALPSFCLF